MSKKKCIYCYKELFGASGFHPQCSRTESPILEYTNDQMLKLAEKVIQSQFSVTGVQAKLSLGLDKLTEKDTPQKLTIMVLWRNYILKPPSDNFQNLPELEGLTLHLATIAGLETVPHTLIRLASGELSYLTKRINRKGKRKIHMEDMCQLTERMTEAKYRGSYEQIGKAIAQYSVNPG